MKVNKIMCDRCGKEITGNPIRIFPEVVDRESDTILVGMVKADWNGEMLNYDYCEECTEKIMKFAKGNMEGLENDVVIQIKEPTEEEIAGIKKAMKDMPPRVVMVEPKEPTVEVVTAEPKPAPAPKPKAIPKAEPTKTNENQQKPTISNPQKPTATELILQGKSKAEVIKLTGCKEATYNQTKYILKKKGLLPDNAQKADAEPTTKDNVKTYKCSEVGHKCVYASKKYEGLHTCDYLVKEGHRRGCKPEECDKFREN